MSGDINIVSEAVARSLGYRELKREQRIVLCRGTMYLQSFLLILARPFYACLPSIFDSLLETERSAMVVVISPLISIMKTRLENIFGEAIIDM